MDENSIIVSIIVPTIGRASLSRAVESALNQDFPPANFEVIIVNDSGHDLQQAPWQNSGQVMIITTQKHERSVARNTGAAVARGKYLHFLDDDDWLVPGGLAALAELASTVPQDWLFGSTQLVTRAGQAILQLRHPIKGNCFVQVMAGEWVPLQSSWIKANAFFDVGGFNPIISGPEDIDLLRRIVLHNDLSIVPAIISSVQMGEHGSSTPWDDHAASSRAAREAILEEPNCFERLQHSIKQARLDARNWTQPANLPHYSYWQGRVARLYLTSAVWNIRRWRIMTSVSRAFLGFISLCLSGVNVLNKNYWSAVAYPYQSFTFQSGVDESP